MSNFDFQEMSSENILYLSYLSEKVINLAIDSNMRGRTVKRQSEIVQAKNRKSVAKISPKRKLTLNDNYARP